MRRTISVLTVAFCVCAFALFVIAQDASYVTNIYTEPGGSRMVVRTGGSIDIVGTGEIDVESGASFKIAGTAVTSTAAELNYLDVATLGTTQSSRALTLDSNGAADTLRLDSYFLLNPTDSEPTGAEGRMYWDDSENALKVHNGSAWSALSAGSGDNTLDNAYDQGGGGAGKQITADTGAVDITNTDADAAFMLTLTPTPGSSAASGGLSVTSGGNSTEDSIQINNSGSGMDIQGTSSLWTVTKAGVGTFADVQATTATVSGAFTASTNVTLANGGLLTNDTNNEIEFEENSEELSMAFTSNTVTWATDTAMDTMAFGVVDDLTGVGTIAFDAAVASMSLAADGAGDDLTVSVTGAQNASLIMSSAGTSNDAMQLTTSAGGIDITNGGASGGEDLDISSTNASVRIDAGESAADAINIDATAGGINILASGAAPGEDINITATGSSVNVTATESANNSIVISSSNGGIDITAASASAGEDIDISTSGSSLNLSASEADAEAITIQASAGGLDVDAVDDINIAVASSGGADDFRIIQTGAFDASISLEAAGTGADAIRLQASAGGVDIDAVDDINITVASTAGADDLRIIQTGAQDASISLEAAGTGADAIRLQASAGGLDIDAVDDIIISVASTAGADDLLLEQTGAQDASILLQAAGTGADAIGLVASAGSITLSAGSGDINVLHDLDVQGAITGDGGAAVTGMLRAVTNDVDGKTVSIVDAGGVETNSGAGGGGVWNLPEASTAIGMQFTFATVATQNFDINPDDADQILVLTNAAGDAVRNATAGNSLTLVAVDATNWVEVSSVGTWTDVD